MPNELENRILNLENRVSSLEKRLAKRIKRGKITLKDKFDTHDRAQNLLREFEVMRIEDSPLSEAQKEELKTIVKCLVELVDNALGGNF